MLTVREELIVLVDHDALKHSDVIVLLEGDGFCRVEKAVELYKANWASRIVFSGGIDAPQNGSLPGEYVIPELLKRGVRREDIVIEAKSLNTRDEAVEVMRLCRERSWKRIILVASPYHQYRAYLTFLKAMHEAGLLIEIVNASAHNLSWFHETGRGNRFELLNQEFCKIDRYRNQGHVATYEEAIEHQRWKEEQGD